MSVVCAKVYKDRVEIAADSIIVRGYSKDTKGDFSKMTKINDMIIGSTGDCDEASLLWHFAKTHKPETATERDILSFFAEFSKWKKEDYGNSAISNNYLFVYAGKLPFALTGTIVLCAESIGDNKLEAVNMREFDFSNQDIPLTQRGMNRNIKAHLLPDKEMVGLGFHKQADKWFCFKTLDQKYDISFCVEIDATNDALHISVIDEDFGQHYDYQRVLRDSPDSEVALDIWRKVEEQMKKLTDAGLITGHVYGRYI